MTAGGDRAGEETGAGSRQTADGENRTVPSANRRPRWRGGGGRARPRRRALAGSRTGVGGLFPLVGVVLLLYFCAPVVGFLLHAGWLDPGAFARPEVVAAVQHSLLTAPVSTAIATAFGVPLAYGLARSSFRGRALVEALVVLPLVTPPVVGGVMLLSSFGRFTPVGSAAASVGVPLTGSFAGVVLAQTFVAAPFVVVVARAGFAAVDPEIEQAARSLGSGPIETFRRVSLPLARDSVLAGVVLTFARAAGEFGATMTTAYHPRTVPTQIWVTFTARGVEETAPLVVVLLAMVVAVVVGLRQVGRRLALAGP